MVQSTTTSYDAIVIGAGFGGIYMLKKLLDQGLKVKVIDAAGDVGGTWYWLVMNTFDPIQTPH